MTTRRRIQMTITALLLFNMVARADVVSEWNAVVLATVSSENPFAQARFTAIAHLAVFEAVNAITGNYEPYLGTVIAPAGASVEAAAIAAAYRVLATYFPARLPALDAARATSLASIPEGWVKDAGIAIGETAAVEMIAARERDGSTNPEFYLPASSNPGEWQLTPSCPASGGTLLHWRNVKPFGIHRADQFRSEPPPALTSNKYVRDYNEVKAVGGVDSPNRPQDRADAARFYAAVPAPPVWNMVARQLVARLEAPLSETARTFAILNMAISDAAVAVFDTKYHYNFWRPETAIRSAHTDGNPKTDGDLSFSPFIVTPCFPSYPSAHAALSNAAREVLQRIYGRKDQSINLSSPAVPGVNLNYTSLRQITDDIDDARVYGGIHFRFDQEAGTDQGRLVGEYVHSENLGPRQQCSCGKEVHH